MAVYLKKSTSKLTVSVTAQNDGLSLHKKKPLPPSIKCKSTVHYRNCFIQMLVVIALLTCIVFLGKFTIKRIEQTVTAIRKHSLTVAKLKLQSYIIFDYIKATANSPDSIEEVLNYYDKSGTSYRHFFGNGPEAVDAWGHTIVWSCEPHKTVMTGLSLGQDGALGGQGLNEDITLVINISTNVKNLVNVEEIILTESRNMETYGVIDLVLKKINFWL